MIQALYASPFDTYNEGTSACVLGAAAHCLQETRVVRGDDDRNNQRAKDVEDYQSVDETLARLRNVTSWCLAFTGGNGDGFWREYEGEARADERSPECEELPYSSQSGLRVAIECSRILPVAKTESIVIGSTTEEKHDAEDNKA